MKSIIQILLFFLSTYLANGQTKYCDSLKHLNDFRSLVLGKYNVAINDSNHAFYLDSVKHLINLNNPDSSYKASKLMWALYFFDTCKYSLNYFTPYLARINSRVERYYKEVIKGEWNFSHIYFSGLGFLDNSPKMNNTLKRLIFTDRFVEFYNSDTLYRVTKYEIVQEIISFALSQNRFDIHFIDNNEFWTFTIGKRSPEQNCKIYLTRILEPSCACGCSNEIYVKQSILEL